MVNLVEFIKKIELSKRYRSLDTKYLQICKILKQTKICSNFCRLSRRYYHLSSRAQSPSHFKGHLVKLTR